MDYRKTIKLYEEDGTTVMCDFDIVLNRSMAVGALKGYTQPCRCTVQWRRI